MATVIKTIRFPTALVMALETQSETKKISLPDLIRQVLADHLNDADRLIRIENKLDAMAVSIAELGVAE